MWLCTYFKQIADNNVTMYLRLKDDLLLSRKREDDRVILNTLPISHYVEKVRWCMDRCQIEYEEEKDIGIFGVLFTGRMVPTLRVPKHDISISNSSDILKYIYADMLTKDEEKAKFLEPSAKGKELVDQMDKMAAQLRRYLYYHVSNRVNLLHFLSTT